MSIKRIKSSREVLVIYSDLGEWFGYYRARPGVIPFICLNSRLLEGTPGVHLTVYRTLLDYHRAIPLNSPYRLFPITRFFFELVPVLENEETTTQSEVEESQVLVQLPAPEPELVIFARAKRLWTWPAYYPKLYRVVE